jgi:hypothetical protein
LFSPIFGEIDNYEDKPQTEMKGQISKESKENRKNRGK